MKTTTPMVAAKNRAGKETVDSVMPSTCLSPASHNAIIGFVGSVSTRIRHRSGLLGWGSTQRPPPPKGPGPSADEALDRHRQLVPAWLGSSLRNKALEAELAEVVKAGRPSRRGRRPATRLQLQIRPTCDCGHIPRGGIRTKTSHVLATGPGQREFAMGNGISRVNAILGLILTIGMIAMGVAGLNPAGGSYAATQVSANVDTFN
jgi:hypothetical protein